MSFRLWIRTRWVSRVVGSRIEGHPRIVGTGWADRRVVQLQNLRSSCSLVSLISWSDKDSPNAAC